MLCLCVFLAGILLADIQVSCDPVPNSVPASNAIPGCNPDCPDPQPQSIRQCYPTAGSVFCKAAGVPDFTNTFLQAVYSTVIIREVFDVSQTTPRQYTDFFTKYTTTLLKLLGAENAAAIAEFAYRAIVPNFEVITLPILARAFANVAANLLFVEGLLKQENAKDLALAYAKAMAEAALSDMNSDLTSKFQALCNGFVNFLLSLGMNTKEIFTLAAFYIGNEWNLAAVNYKWL